MPHFFSRIFRRQKEKEKAKTSPIQGAKSASSPREQNPTTTSRGVSGPVTNGKKVDGSEAEKSKAVVSNGEISTVDEKNLSSPAVDRDVQPGLGNKDRVTPPEEKEKTVEDPSPLGAGITATRNGGQKMPSTKEGEGVRSMPAVVVGTSPQLDLRNVDRGLPSKEAITTGKGPDQALTATSTRAITTDVAQLWQEALDKWQADTKEFKNKLDQEDVERLEMVKTVDDVATYISDTRSEFIYWRHDKSKLDTFRTFVKSNLGYVLAVGQVVADAASASFPPSASIYKAVTIMISCANSVSADYDLMVDFFREVGMFLGCVNILEGSLSDPKIVKGPLGKIVVEIFATILTLCGMSTRYMSRGRGLHALRNFFKGDDGPLKVAYANIKRKAAQENVYVNHESFTGIQAIKGWKIDERMDRADAKQDSILQVMVFSFDSIDSKLDKLIDSEQVRKRDDQQKADKDELTNLQKKFEKPEISEARAGRYSDVQRTRLKNTGLWLLHEESFASWNKSGFRALWVLGEAGTGKSHLSGLIVETLLENTLQTPTTSVGYFFFGKSTLSVREALCSVVSQIAQKDRAFRMRTIRDIGDKQPDALSIRELWSRFFVPNFQKGSAAQLYLVLDGIDEADPLEIDELLQLLGAENIQDLQIQILFVGRAKLASDIEKYFNVKHEIIRITSEKNHSDVKLLIESKITASPRLRSLPTEQRDEIINIMLDKAQGMMLYVDLKVNDLEHITQPRSILSAARNLPQGLEKLYEKDLTDIEQSAEEQDLPYLNILLRWVTFAVRPLSLRELKCIIQHVYKLKDDFDITSEINLRSGSLFTLSRYGREVVEEGEDEKDQGIVKMDDLFSSKEESGAETGLVKVEDQPEESAVEKNEQEETDRQDDDETTVKLRHASLGDYLRSNDIKRTRLTARLSEGDLELASLTMQIICDPNKDLEDLWEYAASSWLQHLTKIDDRSLGAPETCQVALRIAQVLTSPESAAQLIGRADYDDFDWEYSDSASGTKYRDSVLRWLVKAHGLGLTSEKYSDLPKLTNDTGTNLLGSNIVDTKGTEDTRDTLKEPASSNLKEITSATTAVIGSPTRPSMEPPNVLDHGLTAQLESMMTRSVATAVQQVLKRLKNLSTGQFIFEESVLSGFGDDRKLPIASGFTQDRSDVTEDAAPRYLELGAILAEQRLRELVAWIDEVVGKPSQILVCLAKTILTTWFQEEFIEDIRRDSVFQAYLMAWTCFKSTDRMAAFNLTAASRNTPWRRSEKKVQYLVRAFPELETDSEVHLITFGAHLALGSFLMMREDKKAALVEFDKCLTIANTDLQACKAKRFIAEVHMQQKNHETGCEILEAILKSDLGADQKILEFTCEVHANLGRIYLDKGNYARALEAFEAASSLPLSNKRTFSDPENYLQNIVECLYHLDRHEAILDTFTAWDNPTRDMWLRRFRPKSQTVLHISFRTTERAQFMVECYAGAAKRSKSREEKYAYWFQLADAYWHVLGQPEKALEIYQRVFETGKKKLHSTDPSDLYMWREARSQFTLLLWETALGGQACDKEQISQYLSEITVDFALKAADEQDYFSQNDDRAQSLLCARIYTILEQKVEAKRILDREFKICVDMLEDNVGSNDMHAFDGLTQVLAVAGRREEAVLSYSLVFSNVNPQGSGEEEDKAEVESDSDSDDEENEKEGESASSDLVPTKSNVRDEDLCNANWGCDNCFKTIRNFSEPVFTCLVCPNIDLCGVCHKKIVVEDKSDLKGFIGAWKYCNVGNHEYLGGPVEGWKGVKDGIIRYGGKEVPFPEWLEGLKTMWKALEL